MTCPHCHGTGVIVLENWHEAEVHECGCVTQKESDAVVSGDTTCPDCGVDMRLHDCTCEDEDAE